MIFLDIATFFGRFHPLIVHLPIGFLLMAALLLVASHWDKRKTLIHAVPFSLLMGSISSAFACITGYLLSIHGDYDADALQTHMITGIATAFISFVAYLVSRKKIPSRYLQARHGLMASVIVMMMLLFVTGHLGGSLTHGPEFIGTHVLFEKLKEKRDITRAEDAFVFEDLVQPILLDKCGNCHSPTKKKGQLSVASLKDIQKGGKHGKVIVPGQPMGSEMIKRVSLDPNDEKFMPSDGKPPLTSEETAILKWWIEKAAGSQDKKLGELNAPGPIIRHAAVYFNLQPGGDSASVTDTLIRLKVPPLRNEAAAELIKAGFAIKNIHLKPDLLDVTLPAISPANGNTAPERIKQLLGIKDNIVWLNLSENNISDAELDIVGQFKNLRRLKLNKNRITDEGIKKLKELDHLESINLYNTAITRACLPDLSGMKSLTTVYAWGTDLKQEDIDKRTDTSLQIILGLQN